MCYSNYWVVFYWKKITNYSYFFLIILLISSCSDNEPEKTRGHIDPDFQTYVNRFVEEANLRGVDVDTTHLSVIYTDTLQNSCGRTLTDIKTIVISSGTFCFKNRLDDLTKEILMFHELGHALLNRGHDNTRLNNGDQKSIMYTGDLFSIYNEYCPEKRTYYIDELFDVSTLQPDWAKLKTMPTMIFTDSISNPTSGWKFVRSPGSTDEGSINSSFYVSPGSSLQITATSLSTYAYWSVSDVPIAGLMQSDRVTLSVRAKLENVTGDGFILQISGYTADGTRIVIGTNEFITKIIGSSNFTEYSVDIPYYLDSVVELDVLFIMANHATGNIYIDDVKVIKYD